MAKQQIFFTRDDFPSVAYDLLQEKFDLKYWKGKTPIPYEEMLENVKGVFGIFCYPEDRIDENLINTAGRNLKVISTFSVGYDHLDIKALKSRGIKIGYTPNVLTEATAEHTLAILLAASRRVLESYNEVLTGKWTSLVPCWMLGRGLENATVGIIGAGRIGISIAKKLKVFNIRRLLYFSRSEKQEVQALGGELTSVDDIMKESDFVITSIACNEETKGIINGDRINSMKPHAIFVNIGRGGLVDQVALTEALQNKKIGGAALDVTTPEPLPLNHALLKLPNVVITPHLGSSTVQACIAMAELASKNIIAVLENKKMPAEL